MAKSYSYDDLVEGNLWKGHLCCVDDAATGVPKVVAIEEPVEEHKNLTVAELSTRPELVWDADKDGFVYAGAKAPEDDGLEA